MVAACAGGAASTTALKAVAMAIAIAAAAFLIAIISPPLSKPFTLYLRACSYYGRPAVL
jgi:hypothetical protein